MYQLQAGICIALFTSLYYVLFRKETFHLFNRIYLLGSLILSLILPAVRLPMVHADGTVIPTRIIGAVNIAARGIMPSEGAPENTVSWTGIAYLVISFVFSVYLMYRLVGLINLVAGRGFYVHGRYRIVVMPEKTPSFSFFNLVFLSKPAVQRIENNPVLLHEMAHARQMHSFDILLVQIIKIFQWFNPFIYMAEKALQETHEYLADFAVLEQDGEPDRYRLLLLTQVFGVQPGIFNFFNHSLIKNRLTMMTKEKSLSRNRFKYLAAFPLVVILGLIICCKEDKTVATAPPPPPPPPPAELITAEEEAAFVIVDEQASFQGGDINDFRDWVQKNVVYPPEAVKEGIFGRVTTQFAVNSAGKVCDVKILRGVDPMLDKETVRVLELSPEWEPAKVGGKKVKQQFVIPVIYMLK
jgi:TonB family protein